MRGGRLKDLKIMLLWDVHVESCSFMFVGLGVRMHDYSHTVAGPSL